MAKSGHEALQENLGLKDKLGRKVLWDCRARRERWEFPGAKVHPKC